MTLFLALDALNHTPCLTSSSHVDA